MGGHVLEPEMGEGRDNRAEGEVTVLVMPVVQMVAVQTMLTLIIAFCHSNKC